MKNIGCELTEYSVALPPSCQREPARSQFLFIRQSEYMLFLGILANFNLTEKAFLVGLFENFCA